MKSAVPSGAFARPTLALVAIFPLIAASAYAADDTNLKDVSSPTGGISLALDQYTGLLEALEQTLSDPSLQRLVSQYREQLQQGDVQGAESTLAQLQDALAGQAPELEQLLQATTLEETATGEPSVMIDPDRLITPMTPGAVTSKPPTETAADLQTLAQAIQEQNPELANELMDLSLQLTLGNTRGAGAIYDALKGDLLKELLSLDPQLLAQLLSLLPSSLEKGSGQYVLQPPEDLSTISLGPTGLLSDLARAPPTKNLPGVWGNVPTPAVGSILPFIAFLLVAIGAAAVLLQPGLRSHARRAAQRLAEGLRPTAIEAEPADPREHIFYHFRRLVMLMAGRGVVKQPWETHREFASKCRGRLEEPSVAKVAGLFERARFTLEPVTAVDADECAQMVRSVEGIKLEA